MTDSNQRGDRLDELNKATFRRQARNIVDRGLQANDPDSALYQGPGGEPGSPLRAGLLEALRANAEAVYGDPPKRAPRALQARPDSRG